MLLAIKLGIGEQQNQPDSRSGEPYVSCFIDLVRLRKLSDATRFLHV
jgi:hypothetical protein